MKVYNMNKNVDYLLKLRLLFSLYKAIDIKIMKIKFDSKERNES
jgi:hypothetical protein